MWAASSLLLWYMIKNVDEAHANVVRACKQKRTLILEWNQEPSSALSHYTLLLASFGYELEVQRKMYVPGRKNCSDHGILWLNAFKKKKKERKSQLEWRWRATSQQSDTGLRFSTVVYLHSNHVRKSCETKWEMKGIQCDDTLFSTSVQLGVEGGWGGVTRAFTKRGGVTSKKDVCSR